MKLITLTILLFSCVMIEGKILLANLNTNADKKAAAGNTSKTESKVAEKKSKITSDTKNTATSTSSTSKQAVDRFAMTKEVLDSVTYGYASNDNILQDRAVIII
jgi:hypothetical protein